MGKGWILKKSPLDRKALRLSSPSSASLRCRGEQWRGPGLCWQTQLLPLQDCEERKGGRRDHGAPLEGMASRTQSRGQGTGWAEVPGGLAPRLDYKLRKSARVTERWGWGNPGPVLGPGAEH